MVPLWHSGPASTPTVFNMETECGKKAQINHSKSELKLN